MPEGEKEITLSKNHQLKKKISPAYYEPAEEKLNIITHGIGLIISVFALIALVLRAQEIGAAQHEISFLIYGISMVVLYAASTFFHSAQELNLRTKLNIFDHCAIYVFIAGTYTPYSMVTLNGAGGMWLMIVIWSIAAVGVMLKLFFTGRYQVFSTLMYVAMGWLVVFAIKPLMLNLPLEGLLWLLAGGISYTIGAMFFLLNQVRFNHVIFHLFVMAGSVCHFISIYGYVR